MFVRVRAYRTVPSYVFRRALRAAVSSALAAVFLVASPAFAQDTGVDIGKNGVAFKAGALGLGLEYTRSLGERVAFRGALYGSHYGFDSDESDIEYAFDLIWDSFSLGIHFHPGTGPFRLSAGYLGNENRLEGVATPTEAEEIGDSFYTPAQIGTLNGLITVDESTTFAGLGWDWSRKKSGFGMSLDLGVVSQSSPVIDLQATGTAASNPAFQNDLAAEEAEIQEDLDDLDVMPYVSLGFVFRF